jgi:hypothetical protein
MEAAHFQEFAISIHYTDASWAYRQNSFQIFVWKLLHRAANHVPTNLGLPRSIVYKAARLSLNSVEQDIQEPGEAFVLLLHAPN